MSMTQLKKACLARVEESFKAAEKHYGVSIPRVKVTFSNKQTRTAGTAHFRRIPSAGKFIGTEIRLSAKLLELNGEAFISDTPGHEAAHIIAAHLFQEAGHGRKWREVMRVIGQHAKRCHNMAVPTTNNHVSANCGCRTHIITKNIATRIRNGHTYVCKTCKQPLSIGARPTLTQVDNLFVAPKPKATTSKADQVRAIIRNHPAATIDELIELTLQRVAIPKSNVKRYVTENVKKIRG